MKNLLDQLKQYWFLIAFTFAGAASISGIVAGSYIREIATESVKSDAIKLYIQGLIKAELDENATITELNGHITLHQSRITVNADDIDLTQQQLQDVARILMQP